MMPNILVALAIGLVIGFILGYGARALISYRRRRRARQRYRNWQDSLPLSKVPQAQRPTKPTEVPENLVGRPRPLAPKPLENEKKK
jgi:hypothetical protein